MSQDDVIRAEGVVVEKLASGMYRLKLPNGHNVLGFVAGRAKTSAKAFEIGERVALEMTPYDMSKGRIKI